MSPPPEHRPNSICNIYVGAQTRTGGGRGESAPAADALVLIEDLVLDAVSTMGGNILLSQGKLPPDAQTGYYKAVVTSANGREAVAGEEAAPPSLGFQAHPSSWESPADQPVRLGRAPAPRGPAPRAGAQEGPAAPILFRSWSKGWA